MNNPLLNIGILLLACGIFHPYQGDAQPDTSERRPNFLIIFTDDQTYRAIGYTNKLIKTPNLDKLAKNGIIFDRCYTSTPVCTASRASIMTGLFPQTNGTVALNTASFIKNIVEEKKFPTFPEILSASGYDTYFSGKSHLGEPRAYGFQQGKESFDYDDRRAFADLHEMIGKPDFGSRPFLVWLAPRQPHVPLKPADKWLQLYAGTQFPKEANFAASPPRQSFYNQGLPGEHFYRDTDYTNNYKQLPAGPPRSLDTIREFTKAYYATISHLDAQVGELMDTLRKKGLLQNTVIIFIADNGYFLGNHGLGNKLTMHEESVRVPMFVRWDGLPKTGVRCDALVSSVDLMPTILDLAGCEIPSHCQGVSIKPLLFNTSHQLHDYVVSESVGVGGVLGTGHRMVASRQWKYILSDTGEEALFNLRRDPFELKNVISKKKLKSELQALRYQLSRWKELTGDKKDVPAEYR